MDERHYKCDLGGGVGGLFLQVHEMTPQQFFLLGGAYCESLAAYTEGPYKEAFNRMIEKVNKDQVLHRSIIRAKEELTGGLNCWLQHPGKTLQFHQFVLYAVSSVICEVGMIIVSRDLIDDDDFALLTSFYEKVMGAIPEKEGSVTEVPNAFRSAFDSDVPEETVSSSERGSREVVEESSGPEASPGRSYFYDPSDS